MMNDRSILIKKIFLLLIIINFSILNLYSIEFSKLTVSEDDRLLFKADFEGQHAVFISKLDDLSIKQLTASAEKLYLVDNGRSIIALNRFGASNIKVSGGVPSQINGFPSFAAGNIPLKGRLQEIAPSSDGRWIVYIDPISPGYGNLILINAATGEKKVVSERIELPGAEFPVKWSPDSRLFVYEKNGRLFYFPIIDNLSVLINERFRMIGDGRINSILWTQRGDFYYFTGSTVYRIVNPELFTRSIYGDFLSIGTAAAVTPFNFDPGFDRFWIAPDSGSILIIKGGRGIFFLPLGETKSAAGEVLPYIPLPFGAENFNVLWPSGGSLSVIYSYNNQVKVHRFNINKGEVNSLPVKTVPAFSAGEVSPDGTKAVFWGESGIELWDYASWQLIQKINSDNILSCVWINSRQIITGSSNLIEEINVSAAPFSRRVICLSGAEEFGFEEINRGQSRIIAKSGGRWYANDGNVWASAANAQMRPIFNSSDRYRVFLEPQSSAGSFAGSAGYFKNIPMIRNMQSTVTISLLSKHAANKSFTLNRPAQIAICFDLYDDDTGLQQVLSALRRNNIKATFFLNGNLIRRNPAAASAIAQAGHECASMFYAPIDLSDTRYRITREFIAQGLARNEDEFHRTTGKELTILWHPPFYRTSNLVNTAASGNGYITVTRSYDPGDWISKEDSLRLNLRQVSPAEMIELIIQKRETSGVIPIRLGLLPGGRDEYLFERIDVLLDALLRSGYTVVPVSNVIK